MNTFKDHFIQLFDYDRYASLQIFKLFQSSSPSMRSLSLLSHLLGSQQIWLKRCRKEQYVASLIWPVFTAEELEPIMEDNYHQWINFLYASQESDFSLPVVYQNSRGETFHDQLSDIIMHVINHGTHHRAQVGQLLKFDGIETLPPTDYILFTRERRK